jgi:hypothetical protein
VNSTSGTNRGMCRKQMRDVFCQNINMWACSRSVSGKFRAGQHAAFLRGLSAAAWPAAGVPLDALQWQRLTSNIEDIALYAGFQTHKLHWAGQ